MNDSHGRKLGELNVSPRPQNLRTEPARLFVAIATVICSATSFLIAPNYSVAALALGLGPFTHLQTGSQTPALPGWNGPFSTANETVNRALSLESALEQQTDQEWGSVIIIYNGQFYYSEPQAGPPPNNGQYTVTVSVVKPDGAKMVDFTHSHPGNAEPGGEDFGKPYPVWFIDSETGDRYVVDPKTQQVINKGPMSADPEDGVLPPSDYQTYYYDPSFETGDTNSVEVAVSDFAQSLTSDGGDSSDWWDSIFGF